MNNLSVFTLGITWKAPKKERMMFLLKICLVILQTLGRAVMEITGLVSLRLENGRLRSWIG